MRSGDAGGLTSRRLQDQVAIITGAAGGQGRVVAQRFLEEGARVVMTDREAGGLEEVHQSLRRFGTRASIMVADVCEELEIAQVVQTALATYGQVDTLYNNAGVYTPGRDGPTLGVSADDWDYVMRVNLRGAFLFSREALPSMRARKSGLVMNVASWAGISGDATCHAYAASKAGLIALTRSLAQAYGPEGIRAVTIVPGYVTTSMSMTKHEIWSERAEASSLRRLCTPDDVAKLAVFLASDEASLITGGEYRVDGGRLF